VFLAKKQQTEEKKRTWEGRQQTILGHTLYNIIQYRIVSFYENFYEQQPERFGGCCETRLGSGGMYSAVSKF
jgi:hypothetical protein